MNINRMRFFDRHVKTRIALQLVLDGLPAFMLALAFAISILQVNELLPTMWAWSHLTNFCLSVLMYGGGAVLFLLGIWLRRRAEKAFGGYPKCQTISDMLRVLSAIPAFISFICLVSYIFNCFKIL